ncbi:hypothetical protein INR49_012645 [Caranx melampygus]|nr:hypothetical protein INR49_012645 [Caranx melampygus]
MCAPLFLETRAVAVAPSRMDPLSPERSLISPEQKEQSHQHNGGAETGRAGVSTGMKELESKFAQVAEASRDDPDSLCRLPPTVIL